jgi:DNA-directed RNA polymerase specialized sigma24 family protein
MSAWLAQQERAADEADALLRTRHALTRMARDYAGQVCRRAIGDDEPKLNGYVGRLWRCVEHHWRQAAAEAVVPFVELVSRLEAGTPEMAQSDQRRNDRQAIPRSNRLFEVTLAEALEHGEAAAAARFEAEYMPAVRATAGRLGGPRAIDRFDNFAAELILPRGARPPRIAGYQGRTPLAAWLRAVVTNAWISDRRKRGPVALEAAREPFVHSAEAQAASDPSPCEELLRPIVSTAVAALDAEERLILKLLVLDEVPQFAVARSLGVHSGTLTRRRQRAAQSVLAHIERQLQQSANRGRMMDCLERVLTEGDGELRLRLAEVLSAEVRSADSTEGP